MLAARLGISPSYLNLIEHDQRGVTASLLIKLTETLRVDLGALSGIAERQLETGLREAFADPLLGIEPVPDAELSSVAASPAAARAVLALYRAWRVAREESGGIRFPPAAEYCFPTKRRGTSSMSTPTIFPAWRFPPKPSAPAWRCRRTR